MEQCKGTKQGKSVQLVRKISAWVFPASSLLMLPMFLTGISQCQPTDADEDEWSIEDGDCDDNNAEVHPGAEEVCNGIDDNCDAVIDEGVLLTYYGDADGDGYGDDAATMEACSVPEDGSLSGGDCDDSNAEIFPGQLEVCNGIDDGCDGSVDEGVLLTYYTDLDGDGFGDSATQTEGCELPENGSSVAGDCDDTNAAIFPEQSEQCNHIDDDCDAEVDEGVLSTYYIDADGDGYGDGTQPVEACSTTDETASTTGDCNDQSAAAYPGALEVCDTEDNDCDALVDEGALDSDGDGVVNCLDSSIYNQTFDSCPTDLSVINISGTNSTNWYCSSGSLVESSNAGNSAAMLGSFGYQPRYRLSTLVYNGSSGNNAAGFVFAYVDASNYYILRWNDPTNYYTTGYLSNITLQRMEKGVLRDIGVVAGDSTYAASAWISLVLTVDGSHFQVDWNGIASYLVADDTAGAAAGPGRVGLYSWDNDSGVYYDYLTLSTP